MEDNINQVPPTGNKKMIIIVAVALTLIMLLLFVAVAMQSTKKSAGTSTGAGETTSKGGGFLGLGNLFNKSNTAPAAKKISNNDVAGKIIGWLVTQKNSDGIYYESQTCGKDGSCKEQAISYQDGIPVIWAEIKYYEMTKNANVKVSLDKDLATYKTNPKLSGIQNNFLNCRLVYEVYQSAALTEDQRTTLKNACLESIEYPLNIPDDTQLPNFDINKVLKKQQFFSTVNPDKVKIGLYAMGASNYVGSYNIMKQPIDLKRSVNYFIHALVALSQYQDTEYIAGKPFIGLASYDLYTVTNDLKYLNFASDILKEYRNSPCLDTSECVGLTLLAQKMSSKDPAYKNDAQNVVNGFLNKALDYPGYSGYLKGFGGVHTISDPNVFDYPIPYNALLAGVLSEK